MTTKYKFRFFFEYGGGCLWSADANTESKFGYPVRLEKLRLSKETLAKLERLEAQFQTSLNWNYPPDPSPWRQQECNAFNFEVERLVTEVIQELGPDYEIVNEQQSLREDPDLDAYLKNPHEFRRTKAGE